MESYLSQISSYFLNVLYSTFNQLFILFAPLLILVLLLNLSAVVAAGMSLRFWGRDLFLYGFGWFGCSVHEISHAFFAILFGHKINEIELFKPNGDGASLGHVSHSYNKKSIYQKIGNFFIGISPLLSGGIVLFFAAFLLFHFNVTNRVTFSISTGVFIDINLLKQIGPDIMNGLKSIFTLVFTGADAVWWKSALFLYILYSTGTSMTLSKSDVGSAITGFMWVILLFLVFNLVTRWMGPFATDFLASKVKYISGFYFLLILSLITNLIFALLLAVLNLIKGLIAGR